MGVTNSAKDGIDTVLVEHGGLTQIFATAQPNAEDDLPGLLYRLWRVVQTSRAEVLEMRIFGTADGLASCPILLPEIYGRVDWPVACIEGDSCFGGRVAGIQLHAVSGCSVSTLESEGRPVGRVFSDDHARYCVLGNLQSSDPLRARERQTRDTIEQLMGSLASAGMNIHSIVRTWFFIADILGWYPAFNRVRSEIYSAEGVFDRYVPASTGIGGYNPGGAALVASALAIRPRGEGITVQAIPSPLQCPAVDYGSSFSRAAEVVTPDCRSISVSGTASIDQEGATTHLGDADAQIEFTLEVVGAILNSRDMGFADVTRGNAYFKDPADAEKLEGLARRYGLPLSRVVVSHNDVCRDDLLFELEVDAVRVEERG
jgi:enamine deaminase RidA (YjgF/YER057c/UK114 family)